MTVSTTVWQGLTTPSFCMVNVQSYVHAHGINISLIILIFFSDVSNFWDIINIKGQSEREI